jgi:hypothetical protein
VKVGVDHEFHRLRCEFLDLFDESAGGGRFGVRVHDEHSIVEQNDGSVAVDLVRRLRDSGVYAFRDGLDVEEVVGSKASGREEQQAEQTKQPFHVHPRNGSEVSKRSLLHGSGNRKAQAIYDWSPARESETYTPMGFAKDNFNNTITAAAAGRG